MDKRAVWLPLAVSLITYSIHIFRVTQFQLKSGEVSIYEDHQNMYS